MGEVLGEVIKQEELHMIWIAYLDEWNEKKISFQGEDFANPHFKSIFGSLPVSDIVYIYQGVLVEGNLVTVPLRNESVRDAVFLLDGNWKPAVEISRSRIVSFPLELTIAVNGILNKYGILEGIRKGSYVATLSEWREAIQSSTGKWVFQNCPNYMENIMQKYRNSVKDEQYNNEYTISFYGKNYVLDKYFMAYLQDHYSMTINYENGQIVTFCARNEDEQTGLYDLFPPMMFCNAASVQSRKYICHAKSRLRRGITADHPFIVWLLEHSVQLNQHFQRQFQQIIECLQQKDASDIVKEYKLFRDQLRILSAHYKLDVSALPELSMEDFWSPEDQPKEENCPF